VLKARLRYFKRTCTGDQALGPEGKVHRVDPDFGSTLTVSNRASQSNCWVNWKIMGQPCEFHLLESGGAVTGNSHSESIGPGPRPTGWPGAPAGEGRATQSVTIATARSSASPSAGTILVIPASISGTCRARRVPRSRPESRHRARRFWPWIPHGWPMARPPARRLGPAPSRWRAPAIRCLHRGRKPAAPGRARECHPHAALYASSVVLHIQGSVRMSLAPTAKPHRNVRALAVRDVGILLLHRQLHLL
jgi:hypothetical protein